MLVCLGHVEDDPGEERPGTRAWHSEVASGSRRHESFRAHPGQEEPCASNTPTARLTMIVLDASVVVELLTNGILADSIRSHLSRRDESFIVPHLIDVEVVSAIRRLVASQRIGAHRSDQFLTGLAALPAELVARLADVPDPFALRDNPLGPPETGTGADDSLK